MIYASSCYYLENDIRLNTIMPVDLKKENIFFQVAGRLLVPTSSDD